MSDVQTITKLRAQTGAGMMDCKKALEEAGGDYDKAIDCLRKRGEAKAAKKMAERETKEGIVYTYVHSNNKTAAMLELFCETDFVAQNADFNAFATTILDAAIANSPESLDALKALNFNLLPDCEER